MNLFEPDLSRRMARVVQTMPSEIKDEFIEAIKKAPSRERIAQPFRSYLEKGYKPEINELDKNADIYKNNPNRDSKGRFTFGSGGPQAGGGGGAGSGESGENAGGGSGGAGEPGEGKDITSELATEYGTDGQYTQRSADLRDKEFDPNQRGDATLEDIAKKQGFDGKAEMVDQEAFDKVVAEGGTVTYRGITDFHDGPGPDANYIDGQAEITDNFAQGEYFAGNGVYGNGTYTSVNLGVAQGYASEDGKKGSVVTMAIKPSAKIATPEQWESAKLAAKKGTGGFTGATDQGRILAAQGFDGFTIAPKTSEHWASETIVILNRKALVVLKK
jgi:hypothetical protein